MSRLAVIGLGRWGRELVRVVDHVDALAMCCNSGGLTGQAWVREHYPRSKVGSTAVDAFADPQIDGVVLATPIATHGPLTRTALEAGKHVFVEKPLSIVSTEARELVELADRLDRRLFVGHTFLYDAALERVHDLVADDPVIRMSFRWWKTGTFGEPLIWNLLPHEVGLAMWLAGRAPTSVTVLEAAGVRTDLDRLRLRLGFGQRGPDCEIDIDRVHDGRTKSVDIATRSGARYRWLDGSLVESSNGDRPLILASDVEEPLVREMRAFLDSVATARPARTDGRFGADVVEAIEAVRDALTTGPGADLGRVAVR
jgi:UDP-2-acetamido-3-amino-2,3-dideoxy-glucuronate N-acetyltransferase